MLAWLESFGIAVWLRESPSVWAHATVLTVHTTGMAILVGASWLIDLRLLGISRNIPLSDLRWAFRAVGVGLFLNLVTGVLLFLKNATTWGVALPFIIKMFLVIASAATLVPIRSYVMTNGAAQGEVTRNIRLLAITSIVAWSLAVTAGRLLAYLVV